jgi:hypothetical protein
MLRRTFGPKGDEVTGQWEKLHNEEPIDLYSSPNIVRVIRWRRMRWAGHVARMGERRGVYKFLVGSLEGKSSLGRPSKIQSFSVKRSPRTPFLLPSCRM